MIDIGSLWNLVFGLISGLASEDRFTAMLAIMILVTTGGLILVLIVKLIRALWPFMVIGGVVALVWYAGLLDKFGQVLFRLVLS